MQQARGQVAQHRMQEMNNDGLDRAQPPAQIPTIAIQSPTQSPSPFPASNPTSTPSAASTPAGMTLSSFELSPSERERLDGYMQDPSFRQFNPRAQPQSHQSPGMSDWANEFNDPVLPDSGNQPQSQPSPVIPSLASPTHNPGPGLGGQPQSQPYDETVNWADQLHQPSTGASNWAEPPGPPGPARSGPGPSNWAAQLHKSGPGPSSQNLAPAPNAGSKRFKTPKRKGDRIFPPYQRPSS